MKFKIAFWVFVIVNIMWWCACMVGLLFLLKTLIEIEWLERN